MAPDKRMHTRECQDFPGPGSPKALTLSHSPLERGANP